MMILFNRWHGFDVCNQMGTYHRRSIQLDAPYIQSTRSFAFSQSELRYRRESGSTPQPEASPLGSGERPVPARGDIVAPDL